MVCTGDQSLSPGHECGSQRAAVQMLALRPVAMSCTIRAETVLPSPRNEQRWWLPPMNAPDRPQIHRHHSAKALASRHPGAPVPPWTPTGGHCKPSTESGLTPSFAHETAAASPGSLISRHSIDELADGGTLPLARYRRSGRFRSRRVFLAPGTRRSPYREPGPTPPNTPCSAGRSPDLVRDTTTFQ